MTSPINIPTPMPNISPQPPKLQKHHKFSLVAADIDKLSGWNVADQLSKSCDGLYHLFSEYNQLNQPLDAEKHELYDKYIGDYMSKMELEHDSDAGRTWKLVIRCSQSSEQACQTFNAFIGDYHNFLSKDEYSVDDRRRAIQSHILRVTRAGNQFKIRIEELLVFYGILDSAAANWSAWTDTLTLPVLTWRNEMRGKFKELRALEKIPNFKDDPDVLEMIQNLRGTINGPPDGNTLFTHIDFFINDNMGDLHQGYQMLLTLRDTFQDIRRPFSEIADDLKHLIVGTATAHTIDNAKLEMIETKAVAFYVNLMKLSACFREGPLQE